MEKVLYDLMDWERIEGVVYSEEDYPMDFLGPHVVKEGVLIQCFFPDAIGCELMVSDGKKNQRYAMELADEAGFFAILLQGKRIPKYSYEVSYSDGTQLQREDPYAFAPLIDAQLQKKFLGGIFYNSYDYFGAHPMERDGVKGVEFAVWAPHAMRVSVVGDFNFWDGRIYQMHRIGDCGVFELFIPGLEAGTIYKYEVRMKGGLSALKADPYAFGGERRPNNASVIYDISDYTWQDQGWMEQRKKTNWKQRPMSIYEVHLGSWKKPDVPEEDLNEAFYNYREVAPMLAEYVKKMGYTHIELLPVMEHPFDGSWGYQVTGYYAVTARYGTPEDFMYFMDYMHQQGIGVILDWVPAHFPRDAFGLAKFDGTPLYEHPDPRKGSHPHWGTLIFNYESEEVKNFLISNAVFWLEKYHADGIRMDAVASMLYLDYGKQDGEWLPNIYGSNENLEAIEFLKHLNSILKGRKDGAVIIAEESTSWPKITGPVEDDGLGFDFKWNMGWMNDFIDYMCTDPLFRKGKHGELTFSLVYAYSENFILVLSHDEVVHGKGSMINKMPGTYEEKFANLRAAYGFMMTHPGKKLLFMGQEFAQFSEWNEAKGLDWMLPENYDSHRKMQKYVTALNALYQDYPALYEMDHDERGFEWISSLDGDHSTVAFMRYSENKGEDLLIVCNFTPVVREEFKVGVPYQGKFKETFNSDHEEFGGQGSLNTRLKNSKKETWDGRENSIEITLPALGICVFTCTEVEEERVVEKKRRTTSVKCKTGQKSSKKSFGKTKAKTKSASGKKSGRK